MSCASWCRSAAVLALTGCAPNVVCAPAGRLCTVAGVPGINGFNGEPRADRTWLYFPTSVDLDPDGRLVIDDFNNMRIRRLEDDDTLSTVLGTGQHAVAIEGVGPLQTPLENPIDASYGPSGDLVVAELHTGRVLRVDDTVHVLAGTGDIGFAGDGGPAVEAWLSESGGIDVDTDGTVYVCDTENHVVRAVDPDGMIRTVAGSPERPGWLDGFDALMRDPQKCRLDGEGGLLIADSGNHAIRRLDLQTGAMETVAGTAASGYTGDGGPATVAALMTPYAARATADGGLLIADSGNHAIRYVDPDGTITTLVGTGRGGSDRDGTLATEARLDFPVDVLPDGEGGLYIADMRNGAVRHLGGVLP